MYYIQTVCKPSWNTILNNTFSGLPVERSVFLDINGCQKEVVLHLHSATFDLPALASVLNIKQFNDQFGCAFCEHPGESVVSGRDHVRVYLPQAQQCNLISNSSYLKYADLADKSGECIFGIQGKCVLSRYINVPGNILVDGMHLIYENVIHKIFNAMFNVKYSGQSFYLGRPHMYSSVKRMLLSVSKPHDMSSLPVLSDLKFWKAHHFKHFLLYYSFPIFCCCLPVKEFIFMAALILSAYLSNDKNARLKTKFLEKCVNYLNWKSVDIFPKAFSTINLHMMLHLPNQVLRHGPPCLHLKPETTLLVLT